MNHRKFGIKLGRNRREREALFKSLVRSVFTHGTIQTTEAKAKSVVPIIEKLSSHINTKDKLVAIRELSTYIQDKNLVSQIFNSFKKHFPTETSNFTRITRVKIRQGDDALIVKFGFYKPYVLEAKPASKDTKSVKVAKVEAEIVNEKTKTVSAKSGSASGGKKEATKKVVKKDKK
jgi:large subunit ribosomal protein L17